jgi:hypothetical protein
MPCIRPLGLAAAVRPAGRDGHIKTGKLGAFEPRSALSLGPSAPVRIRRAI